MKNYNQRENQTGNYRYFVPTPQTAEEVKKLYKELTLKHHPDQIGGDEEVMKVVNQEYKELFAKLKDIHENKEGERYTSRNPTSETPRRFY
ncbi:MAG: hypothetical protein FWB74_03500 [Defluviitaleaceae bacterium]|nr:hypothetical protein [Defluviitaleaceae bacterium]